MTIKELYLDLTKAYSNDNLNRITRKLLVMYKNKNYHKIRALANKISKYVTIDEEKDAKCFSKLIMLYHPDRGENVRKAIQNIYEQNNFEKLQQYSHVLLLNDIENINIELSNEDIGYSPEYVWDINMDAGYSFSGSEEYKEQNNEPETVDFEKSFYNMIKIKEYGNIDVELPTYYFEDFEEFEMAHCGLESLDGVEFCIHVKILDVSNNAIIDLNDLKGLIHLEELYLANNEIGYVDILSNNINLKTLDLSGNQIDDISPILDLPYLAYVNLAGNPVPKVQIEVLEKKGVLTIFDN